MAYTYTSFVTALATELAVDSTETNFVNILPTLIDSAEQRIYRELDLVSTSVTVNGAATANSRIFALPQGSGHLIVVNNIHVFDAQSTRHPVAPATRDTIEFLFPTDTPPTAPCYPRYFNRVDDTNVLWGPAPDSSYTTEVVATIRPNPLSATNTSTFLSNYLSDLFFCAAMVEAAGYLRNFGMQADDPKMGISWEGQYQTKFKSANAEEMRKKYQTAMSSTPTQQTQ